MSKKIVILELNLTGSRHRDHVRCRSCSSLPSCLCCGLSTASCNCSMESPLEACLTRRRELPSSIPAYCGGSTTPDHRHSTSRSWKSQTISTRSRVPSLSCFCVNSSVKYSFSHPVDWTILPTEAITPSTPRN